MSFPPKEAVDIIHIYNEKTEVHGGENPFLVFLTPELLAIRLGASHTPHWIPERKEGLGPLPHLTEEETEEGADSDM